MGYKRGKAKGQVRVSLYQDTRREKYNGLFPTKIRVYDSLTKKARLYTTDFDLSKDQFRRIVFPKMGERLKKEEKNVREQLLALESHYSEKAHDLALFTFDVFEGALSLKSGEVMDVFFQLEKYRQELLSQGQTKSASQFDLTAKSLKNFLKDSGRSSSTLLLPEVTVGFLNSYENWMIDFKDKSSSTVGAYLRNVRTVFNVAIDLNIVNRELYPFGKKKYQIPSSSKVKKALNAEQLEALFAAEPANDQQAKAKAFWFFSFVCQGMNMKDIVFLEWDRVSEEGIQFVREKTKRTKKANSKTIHAPLTPFAEGVIKKYGTGGTKNSTYVFPVLKSDMSLSEKEKAKDNFIRFINQHILPIAKSAGIKERVSSNWARHSFSTSAIRNNISMVFVKEALGHSDIKTTQRYFAGFEDSSKKETIDLITGFTSKDKK
ncbi:tyrosine-type recombinase/integrase [Algoriphagus sediminis]|uniref:Site-specific integrase n=1 Tax=Algoriphagus sediminis TaxID=3057113 RepID=A0ABT7YGI8_9BACT|nr:site-specific integrase [Algoriphagus sediminis]MDN3205641.1 site-specific integrase [Algoriphagus sediminis]